MSVYLKNAIGGYFALELSLKNKRLYPDSLRFQSARAAFYALLLEGKPSRVWMPAYICDSMLAPLKATDTEIVFYDIDSDLGVSNDVHIKGSDWLLYVNYFGVCSDQEERLLKRFNSSQLIFDHSQAFFSPPRDCLANIYSPRKFFGVPDGGFLLTSLPVNEPDEVNNDSVARCTHLLKRLDGTPEAGYQDFKNAEESFNNIKPQRLSLLTDNLLMHVDYETCKKQRNINFHFLHEHLKHLNDLNFDISKVDGPMCYPMLTEDMSVRDRLLSNRIFVPTYWPEVISRAKLGSFNHRLLKKLLPLPCDQRYGHEDMIRIIECLQ
jgi:hypothetical protein